MNYKDLSKVVDSKKSVNPGDYAFLMVRFAMPDFIADIQNQIPEDELYTEEGDDSYGLEKDSHVTLFPCLDNETSVNLLIPYLYPVPAIDACLVNVSLFENDGYDVLKADVCKDSNLFELNSELAKHFESFSEFKEYHPHMTIAYIKKDAKVAKSFVQEFSEPVHIVPDNYDFSWHQDDGLLHCYFDI